MRVVCPFNSSFTSGASQVRPVVKNLPANAEDAGSNSGLGRSPQEGNGNPVQHSCSENPMDRGTWQAAVHGGHKESDMTEHSCKERKGKERKGKERKNRELKAGKVKPYPHVTQLVSGMPGHKCREFNSRGLLFQSPPPPGP